MIGAREARHLSSRNAETLRFDYAPDAAIAIKKGANLFDELGCIAMIADNHHRRIAQPGRCHPALAFSRKAGVDGVGPEAVPLDQIGKWLHDGFRQNNIDTFDWFHGTPQMCLMTKK